jgi:hypothetical protein
VLGTSDGRRDAGADETDVRCTYVRTYVLGLGQMYGLARRMELGQMYGLARRLGLGPRIADRCSFMSADKTQDKRVYERGFTLEQL